ncbi:MAG: hypothetical protein EB127_28375 [Alphaproteobacteria bacterium]|nr:hypothetical protein [Alphaproteobacteria bacterium]
MFKRHPIYLVTHLILGFLGYFYPEVLYATIGYQLSQYALGIRFFLFEGVVKSGNSIEHTAIKLGEVGAGYVIAMLCKASSTT